MTATPRKTASAGQNTEKPFTYFKAPVEPNPLGEFKADVDQAMQQVVADLSSKHLKSWNDAKLREQTRGLIIANVEATEQARARRKQLLTRAQVAEREAMRDETILGMFHEIVEFATREAPLENQPAARKRAQAFVDDFRERIAAKLAKL